MSDTNKTTQITQVGTVIVPVSDQDRALEFYVGTRRRRDSNTRGAD